MNLTVRDIINLDILRGLDVVAGEQGLEKRVNNVTVLDAPDAVKWLRGSEFVVTTLYLFKETKDQVKLIEELALSNASALGIKLNRFVYSISEEVVELANKYSLPVIGIPYEKAWVDLINPIMAEILNRQLVLMEKSNAIRRTFIKEVLEGGKLKSVAKTLSELTGNPITIVELTNRSIITWPYFFKSHVNKSELFGLMDSKMDIQTQFVTSVINSIEGDVVPIEVAKRIEGYIIIWKTKELKELDFIALEQATTVAALHIQQLKAVNEINQRFKDDFIRNLLKGEFSYRYIKQRAEELRWEIGSRTQFVVVIIKQTAGEDWNKSHAIFNHFRDAVQVHYNREILMGMDGNDKFIFLISENEKNICEDAIMAIIRTRTDIMKNEPDLKISIGIGTPYDTGKEMLSSYREANNACKVSMALNEVCRYDELGPYALLVELIDGQETEEYLNKLIYPIVNYDTENQAQLLATLEAFINQNCNYRETAKTLYVHHNTIRYRLGIIEDALNIDIRNPEAILNLMLGLRLYKLVRQ